MTPQGRERGLAAAGHEHRILLDVLFPARQRRTVVLGTHLPAARVAAEEGHIAAVADKLLEMVPHGGRPVLVVTHTEHQLVGLEDFRVRLEVTIGGVLENVSVRLGPLDKGLLPARKLRSRRTLEGHSVPLISPATIEGIKAKTSPVVVGVVGVGGKLQEDLRIPSRLRRSHDEEATRVGHPVRAPHVVTAMILHAELNLIVARLPIRGDGHPKTHRPAASVRGGVGRDGLNGARLRGALPNHRALSTHSGDFHRIPPLAGGDMKGQFSPLRIADFSGIPLDVQFRSDLRGTRDSAGRGGQADQPGHTQKGPATNGRGFHELLEFRIFRF